MKVNRFGMSQAVFSEAMMDFLQSRHAVVWTKLFHRKLRVADRQAAIAELQEVKSIFKKTFLELSKEQESFLLMLEETIVEIEELTQPVS